MKTMGQGVNELIVSVFGAGTVVVVILFLLIAAPAVFIFSVNSLAEAGGADFRIEHGLWNYFVAFLFLMTVNGGGSGGKS
jgi:hypothetical protein